MTSPSKLLVSLAAFCVGINASSQHKASHQENRAVFNVDTASTTDRNLENPLLCHPSCSVPSTHTQVAKYVVHARSGVLAPQGGTCSGFEPYFYFGCPVPATIHILSMEVLAGRRLNCEAVSHGFGCTMTPQPPSSSSTGGEVFSARIAFNCYGRRSADIDSVAGVDQQSITCDAGVGADSEVALHAPCDDGFSYRGPWCTGGSFPSGRPLFGCDFGRACGTIGCFFILPNPSQGIEWRFVPSDCQSAPPTTPRPATPQPTPAPDPPTRRPTPRPTSADCRDNPINWADSFGDSCDWYQEEDENDLDRCLVWGDSFENDGFTANEVCCTCGGGRSTGDDITPSAQVVPPNPTTRPPSPRPVSPPSPRPVSGLEPTRPSPRPISDLEPTRPSPRPVSGPEPTRPSPRPVSGPEPTRPLSPTTPLDDSAEEALPVGAIVGIVVGVLGLFAIVVFFVVRRNNNNATGATAGTIVPVAATTTPKEEVAAEQAKNSAAKTLDQTSDKADGGYESHSDDEGSVEA